VGRVYTVAHPCTITIGSEEGAPDGTLLVGGADPARENWAGQSVVTIIGRHREVQSITAVLDPVTGNRAARRRPRHDGKREMARGRGR